MFDMYGQMKCISIFLALTLFSTQQVCYSLLLTNESFPLFSSKYEFIFAPAMRFLLKSLVGIEFIQYFRFNFNIASNFKHVIPKGTGIEWYYGPIKNS